jgi:hypothetical protein
MAIRAVRTATLEAALAKKAQPVPTALIMTPATAGPRIRPVLKMVEFSPTALARSSLPTISTTNDCRTGLSTAETRPSAVASTSTCQYCTIPATSSRPRTRATSASPDWVASRSLRLSMRSASTPPQSPRTRAGPNCSAVMIPSAVPELVRVSTSQSWATRCIHVPVSETSCPVA